MLSRQGQRLLQLGMALFLYSSFDVFAIPFLASPRIGLSVHTLSALQGVMLLAIGLVWPRLQFSPRVAQIAFWTLIYSTLAILAAYTVAAYWGVGIETISLMGELPHGLSQGTPFLRWALFPLTVWYFHQEILIRFSNAYQQRHFQLRGQITRLVPHLLKKCTPGHFVPPGLGMMHASLVTSRLSATCAIVFWCA